MSREIKFRAWDKDLAKYLGGCEIDSLMAELSADDDGKGVIIKQICPARYIFEQYTGLKDKNGKEIYEGDIVKGDMGVFEVKWYDLVAQFMFRPNMSMKYHPPFTSTQLVVMEVIGNIHENPELLEDKNGRD